MAQTTSTHKPIIDWLTVVAIAALVVSITVGFHEGIHAVTCLVTGGDLQEYSVLHVLCNIPNEKVVAGSASIANLIVGTLLWLFLRRSLTPTSVMYYALWLLMLENWLYDAGYWLFSGIANIGDWVLVIEGWEPAGLWRVGMTILGAVTFMLAIWLSLKQFGRMIGGTADEQIKRATRLGPFSYFAAIPVILLAGVFNPLGLGGLPATAGLLAVLGALSPLLWMMQWFRAKSFVKAAGPALEIQRRLGMVIMAVVVVFVYAVILGRTLYF